MLHFISALMAHLRYPSRERQLRIDLDHTDEELRKALASLERAQAEVSCYTRRKKRLERELGLPVAHRNTENVLSVKSRRSAA